MINQIEHIKRHKKLHKMLDELVADYIRHHPIPNGLPSNTTVLSLMEWSYQQTIKSDVEFIPPIHEIHGEDKTVRRKIAKQTKGDNQS